ncbi:MAG: LLM class flavin-dependent oxidoreductase [Chloroflexi bacterium]|nr:LLM class flavin-dependent oxidoreductase [Chloroflexota bacterium]MBV9601699.1 LLM class flavin-dependent oxidoreductase [Chloroflexota bacterium]
MNRLLDDNPFKLGIFASNVSHGATATTAEGTLEMTWPNTLEIALAADRAGFEALVPVARWKGFGGPTNFNGSAFETYTWAAGLAAATSHISLFSTSHVLTTHPIVAAKQSATIDHISHGRFALNVVCGWFQDEFDMFGLSLRDHDALYAYATEWLHIVRRLWSEDREWDFDGRFFHMSGGFSQPKPIQQPVPVMNAGASGVGARFAAQHADMAFTGIAAHEEDTGQARIAELRRLAREEFGRELQVWTSCGIVCRPTEREAEEFARYYIVEKGDWEAVASITRGRARYAPRPPQPSEPLRSPGWGSYLIVGTPEQVTDRMLRLSTLGLDGAVLSWVNYAEELAYWNTEVLPLLEQAGLREPFAGGVPVPI